jgi:uncharacterized membrane protein
VQLSISKPVAIALALGAIALAAGVLLFVAAHWDALSPSFQFTLLILLVAMFHVCGAFCAGRFDALAGTLHSLGTIALGAGIYLAAQIFNLQEHWPGGVLLWAIGAWIGWLIRKDDFHAIFAAILTPVWLIGEWVVATDKIPGESSARVLATGFLLLAIAYLAACTREHKERVRQILARLGAVALIPAVFLNALAWSKLSQGAGSLPMNLAVIGWSAAFLIPTGVAYGLRRFDAWPNLVAVIWVLLLDVFSAQFLYLPSNRFALDFPHTDVFVYLWCALGFLALGKWGNAESNHERIRYANIGYALTFLIYSIRLAAETGRHAEFAFLWLCPVAGWIASIAWGVTEGNTERINLGVAGFAITIVIFYFSNVMDRLERSLSLVTLGILFLAGGWALERLRRNLVRQAKEAQP